MKLEESKISYLFFTRKHGTKRKKIANDAFMLLESLSSTQLWEKLLKLPSDHSSSRHKVSFQLPVLYATQFMALSQAPTSLVLALMPSSLYPISRGSPKLYSEVKGATALVTKEMDQKMKRSWSLSRSEISTKSQGFSADLWMFAFYLFSFPLFLTSRLLGALSFYTLTVGKICENYSPSGSKGHRLICTEPEMYRNR
jgi:hypothetical protein